MGFGDVASISPAVTTSHGDEAAHRRDLANLGNLLREKFFSEHGADGKHTVALSSNLPMGGFKLTGLGAGSAAGDSIRYDEFISGAFAKGADVASASPLVLGTDGIYFDVTGATGFSAITVAAGRFFVLQFDGALTITHGSGITCPRAENLSVAAGDQIICFSTAANTVFILAHLPASGNIKFRGTQSASSDANTLDDYEEGTWTPTDASGAGLSLTVTSATYTKIGRAFTLDLNIVYPATADVSNSRIGGSPFTFPANVSNGGGIVRSNEATLISIECQDSATTMDPLAAASARITNATLSGDRVKAALVCRV